MKKCFTSLIIQETQIKTIMRVSSHTSKNGHHQKNQQTIYAREGVMNGEPSYSVGGDVNCTATMNSMEVP